MSVFEAADCWICETLSDFNGGESRVTVKHAFSVIDNPELEAWRLYSHNITLSPGKGLPGRVVSTQGDTHHTLALLDSWMSP